MKTAHAHYPRRDVAEKNGARLATAEGPRNQHVQLYPMVNDSGLATIQMTPAMREVCEILGEAVILATANDARLHGFPTTRAVPRLESDILEHISDAGGATPRHLRSALKASRSSVQNALLRLTRNGQLEATGTTRNRAYRLPASLDSAVA